MNTSLANNNRPSRGCDARQIWVGSTTTLDRVEQANGMFLNRHHLLGAWRSMWQTRSLRVPQVPQSQSNPSGWAKFSRGAGRFLGPVGVLGGGLQIFEGIKKARESQSLTEKVEGGLDVVGGTCGVGAGAATTVAAVAGKTALVTAAGTIAVGVGGVGAIADGANDIIQGIRERNPNRIGLGSWKAGAGGLMLAGALTGNPVLMAGGAIAYGGALVVENRKAIVATARAAGRAIGRGVRAIGRGLVSIFKPSRRATGTSGRRRSRGSRSSRSSSSRTGRTTATGTRARAASRQRRRSSSIPSPSLTRATGSRGRSRSRGRRN